MIVVDSRNGSIRGVCCCMAIGVGWEEKPLMQCLFLDLLKNVFYLFLSFFLLLLLFFILLLLQNPPPGAALALPAVVYDDLLGGLAALGAEGLDLKVDLSTLLGNK